MGEFEDRRSGADPVALIADSAKTAQREAENGVRQLKAALDIVRRHLDGQKGDSRLTHAVILELHHAALQDIHLMAGHTGTRRSRSRRVVTFRRDTRMSSIDPLRTFPPHCKSRHRPRANRFR